VFGVDEQAEQVDRSDLLGLWLFEEVAQGLGHAVELEESELL
jgi:hypothetical protein